LRYWGYDNDKITELDWDESADIKGGKIHCLPARHFSGRLFECRTLWASFLVETKDYKLYIGGDSGYDDHYKMISEKFGGVDFALLEAGQYDNNWRYIHENPEEFIQSATDLKAKRVIPVHNSKFCICNHPWYEPLDKISELALITDLDVNTPKIGEVVNLRKNQQFSAWWKTVK
ncbi:MAG: MBL fold metallo-hydrolase, partial [Alphaproteobacteria bacterium]|nr:MBL fold metallo-hydrolase [Alphaproteobacteria bacterium]